MIDHWLKPINDSAKNGHRRVDNDFGSSIMSSFTDILPNKTIVLVGADEKWANTVREHLYGFASCFPQSRVCDLGNFRKNNPEFMIPAITELILAGAIPIVLGCGKDMELPILNSFRQRDSNIHSLFVQESFPSWLDQLQSNEDISILGIQQHLVGSEQPSLNEQAQISWRRLSTARNAMDEIEPSIRDAGLIMFDMSALRSSDFPSQSSFSTSGFSTEEGCQIMRYAGTSPLIQCISLSGHDTTHQAIEQSANTQAQLLWYFVSGFDQRVLESPAANDRFTQYLVHMQQYDFDLIFFKSNNSGRWWLKIPSKESSVVHSCAYGDYLAACEDVISDRVHKFIGKSLDIG